MGAPWHSATDWHQIHHRFGWDEPWTSEAGLGLSRGPDSKDVVVIGGGIAGGSVGTGAADRLKKCACSACSWRTFVGAGRHFRQCLFGLLARYSIADSRHTGPASHGEFDVRNRLAAGMSNSGQSSAGAASPGDSNIELRRSGRHR